MLGIIGGIASKVIGGITGGGGAGGLLGGVFDKLLGGKDKAKEAKPEEVRNAAKQGNGEVAQVLNRIADALEKLLGLKKSQTAKQIPPNHMANKYFN